MTTITIKNGKKIVKTSFEDIEELKEYLFSTYMESEKLSNEHINILDERIKDIEENPTNYISLEELKNSIIRKNV